MEQDEPAPHGGVQQSQVLPAEVCEKEGPWSQELLEDILSSHRVEVPPHPDLLRDTCSQYIVMRDVAAFFSELGDVCRGRQHSKQGADDFLKMDNLPTLAAMYAGKQPTAPAGLRLYARIIRELVNLMQRAGYKCKWETMYTNLYRMGVGALLSHQHHQERGAAASTFQLQTTTPPVQANVQWASQQGGAALQFAQHSSADSASKLFGQRPVTAYPLPGDGTALLLTDAALGKTMGTSIDHGMPVCHKTHRMSTMIAFEPADAQAARSLRGAQEEDGWQSRVRSQQQALAPAQGLDADDAQLMKWLPADVAAMAEEALQRVNSSGILQQSLDQVVDTLALKATTASAASITAQRRLQASDTELCSAHEYSLELQRVLQLPNPPYQPHFSLTHIAGRVEQAQQSVQVCEQRRQLLALIKEAAQARLGDT